MSAGYSGTPLSKKLGIEPGSLVVTINPPDDYSSLLEPLPSSVRIMRASASAAEIAAADLIHFFTNDRDELFSVLAELRRSMKQDAMIWISWYKRAARLPTEITEDAVRRAALPMGLVDVKVCAVDERWSGLKLVIRKELRG